MSEIADLLKDVKNVHFVVKSKGRVSFMDYNSTNDTLSHISVIQERLSVVIQELLARALHHDESKLQEPEKALFDKYTPLLQATTYGSDEYKKYLEEMSVGLLHHYESNSHHPEHYVNGINSMTLIDIIEMLCDWKAATERHADGDFLDSLNHNEERFGLSPQLYQIFLSTARALNWIKESN